MYQGYAGLIFDMDGTLFNSEPVHRKAWRQVLSRHGLRFDETQMAALNGAPAWQIASHIIRLNHADTDPHRLAAEKNHCLENMPFDEIVLLPAADVVKSGYGRLPMAVGTGSDRAIARRLLAHTGLADYFAAVVTAQDVQCHKPAPDTFLRCAELLGVEASRCLVFEDADFGVQAAQRAGMDVVDVRLPAAFSTIRRLTT